MAFNGSYAAQPQYPMYNVPYTPEELAMADECAKLQREACKTQHRILKLARKHGLNCENYERLIKDAKKKVRKLQKLQDAALEQEIERLNGEIAALEAEQAAIERDFKELHTSAAEQGWLSPPKLVQLQQAFAKATQIASSRV
eukprot:m.123232 g.123232  ORF g.123232 m.123232 type:complete len:143 (+) comp15675_c1_seq4:2051-2479(+)